MIAAGRKVCFANLDVLRFETMRSQVSLALTDIANWGLRQLLTMSYTDNGMSRDALSAHQFALASVLAAVSGMSAPLSGSAAFPFASQSLR